ncbi:hypothetical protein CDAR_575701 [Caerostris darwini]|uniref:Uncharacterized protein n=1 Tax=Caerostris darwini TaxID=1538125 RepID=A0AAV4MUJ0_9ARAC|nr:hypothetical protein CDAR_575701 [Caerostris darwini]
MFCGIKLLPSRNLSFKSKTHNRGTQVKTDKRGVRTGFPTYRVRYQQEFLVEYCEFHFPHPVRFPAVSLVFILSKILDSRSFIWKALSSLQTGKARGTVS